MTIDEAANADPREPVPRFDRPKKLSDNALIDFGPFGLLIRALHSPDAPGVRYCVNPGGGNTEWFHAVTEFDADTYFPRRVIQRPGYLLIQREGEDFIATPLTERDAWRIDPYYLE